MLSAESLKQIDTELAKYPADQRRSAIMGALRIAQTEKGWLAPETIAFVADYIGSCVSPKPKKAGSPPKPSLLLPTISASRLHKPTKSLPSTICTILSLSANTN